MKKITLLVFILTFVCVQAQTDDTSSDKLTFGKGTQILNLSLSLNTSNSTLDAQTQTQDADNFGFSIRPSYGYAISDNLFLGLGLGYTTANRENDLNGISQGETKANSFSALPFIRYYKGIGKKLAFFVQGEASYTYSKSETDNMNPRTTNSFFLGVRPGFVFMLSDHIGLETTIGALGYTTSSTEDEANNSEVDFNSFNFSLNSSNLLVGLSYYF